MLSQAAIEKISLDRRLQEEGLAPLLYESLHRAGTWSEVPQQLALKLSRAAKLEALVEDQRSVELAKILSHLNDHGIPSLIFKGTALSHTIYPRPGLRPRADTDILVRVEDRESAAEILKSANYSRTNQVSGEFIMHQNTFSRVDSLGLQHDIDLHWKISNPQIFSEIYSFDELMRNAIEFSIAGVQARMPSYIDSLVIACIHRVAHHYDEENLLWLYDIHLLTEKLSPLESAEFAAKARKKEVWRICRRGLELAQKWFETDLPEAFSLETTRAMDRQTDEKTSAYLRSDRKWFHDVWHDLKNLPSAKQRLQLLKEHAFPHREYILAKYPTAPRALWPLLYPLRITLGLRRIFGRLKP